MPQLDVCVFFPLGSWTVLVVLSTYLMYEGILSAGLARKAKMFQVKGVVLSVLKPRSNQCFIKEGCIIAMLYLWLG